MEGVVQTDDVNESGRVAESDLVGEIPREILGLVEGSDVGGSTEVLVVVDSCFDAIVRNVSEKKRDGRRKGRGGRTNGQQR